MFTDKTLKESVKALEDKVEILEHQEFGKKLQELQRANHKLAEEHHRLDVRFGRWRGIAAAIIFVFTVLGGITAYYLDQYRKGAEEYRKGIEQYRTFEVLRPKAYELLVDPFQDKFADTIDRISLMEPTDEDKGRVTGLIERQDKLTDLGVDNPRFKGLSGLIDVLKLMVIDEKPDEGRDKLKLLKASNDDFVAARALTLEVIAIVSPDRYCKDPTETKLLATDAKDKDSSLAAAFNLIGVCLTEEAREAISGEKIEDAQRHFEQAFWLKPTAWSNIRFRNNKAWANAEFLLAALKQNKLRESLPRTKYETVEAFLDEGQKDLAVCKLVGPRQPGYWGTEAELYGLEYAYYQRNGDAVKAQSAFKKMKEKFGEAIKRGIYRQIRARYLTAVEAAKAAKVNLRTNHLLEPLWHDPEIMERIDTYMSSR